MSTDIFPFLISSKPCTTFFPTSFLLRFNSYKNLPIFFHSLLLLHLLFNCVPLLHLCVAIYN
jgi:hypothetical protein